MALRIDTVLEQVVARMSFRERLREHEVWRIWDEVVGASLAARAQPARIDRGKLFVRVSDPAWMHELQYLKDDLRRRLNARLGRPAIRVLFFSLGDNPPPPPPPERWRTYPVDETAITALVPDGRHPEIARSVRAIARAQARRLGPDAAKRP